MNENKLIVGIADMKMAQKGERLITYALGSCIGICLYDPQIKLAAMVHIMLPINMEAGRKNTFKYADTGIRLNRYIHVSGCFQPMIVHELFNHGQQFHLLEIGLHVLPPLHAERENLFHQLGEQRQLFLADGEVLVQLFRIVSPAEVEQRVIDGISHGDRCLQFMGDVVRKVALHLVECPHAPDHIDKIGKTEN